MKGSHSSADEHPQWWVSVPIWGSPLPQRFGSRYLGVGLPSLPLQEPELLLLLRVEAPQASRTLTGGDVRLEAGRRGRWSLWLVDSCGHWANTARPLRPQGPPLGVTAGERRRGEGGAQTGVTEQTERSRWKTRTQLTGAPRRRGAAGQQGTRLPEGPPLLRCPQSRGRGPGTV